MVIFTEDSSQIKPESLGGFSVGWKNPPSKEKLLQIAENINYFVLTVYIGKENVARSENALYDKISYAYLSLLEVFPNYLLQSIRNKVINLSLDTLVAFYAVNLCCNKELGIS